MLGFLVKRFVPAGDTSSPRVREGYGTLGGAIGIVCNLILFLIKLIAGIMTGSIAVVSDAFNNLSDMGTSVVSVIGAKVSVKRADEGHPYGHGRAEYISALIISFIIIFLGWELLKSSVDKIFNPRAVSVNLASGVILAVSVLTKLWMWRCNKALGDAINSPMLKTASKDSINDAVATTVVAVSAYLSPYVSLPLDGVAGICVSAMIIYAGAGVARGMIDSLMGSAPDEELINKIEAMVTEDDAVLGVHGLMLHDYGPNHIIASVHAEVDDTLSYTQVHSLIDRAEHKIMRELNVDIVIHPDPVRRI